jgi:hypothetical protein
MKFRCLLASIAALLCLAPVVRAQESSAAAAVTQQIQSFYQWYVQALNKNQDPLEKNRAELKRFVSQRLLKEIDRAKKGPDGLDGDYFLDAQDWDKDWAKNIAIQNVKTSGAKGSAEVALSGPTMKRRLQLQLVQEGGAWKVDKVKNLE